MMTVMTFPCTVDGCSKPGRAKTQPSRCGMHDRRFRLTGDVGEAASRKRYKKVLAFMPCSEEDCDRDQYAKGLCNKHWQKARLASRPELREAAIVRTNQWVKENPERYRETSNRIARERYANKTPEERREFWMKKLLPREAPGWTNESAEYLKIVLRDPCVYCGGPSDTLEHIIPVTRGGDNAWDNFAGACRSCNSSKGTQTVLHFMLRKVS